MSKDRIPADYFSRIKNQEILNAANISLFDSKLRLFFLSCMLIFLMTTCSAFCYCTVPCVCLLQSVCCFAYFNINIQTETMIYLYVYR